MPLINEKYQALSCRMVTRQGFPKSTHFTKVLIGRKASEKLQIEGLSKRIYWNKLSLKYLAKNSHDLADDVDLCDNRIR